ncbi:MAG: F0F1 ATP synthase subunit delta [uncultured bacterium]|nr:MAG: F0F1 ATP synthase subunit delta [uncultured bacterium]
MTGKMTTIARPYAVAAFEYAAAHHVLPAWEAMLSAAAIITENPLLQSVFANPKITAGEVAQFYCDILAKQLDKAQINFIHLLAEHNRFGVLPDIAALFKQYRLAAEKKLTVQIISATKLDDQYKQKLTDALIKRLQKEVSLECHIDADLLGGAMAVAGDQVIDGSVRGKLNRMIEFISGTSVR